MEFSTLAPNEGSSYIRCISGIGLETTKILINAGYKLSIGVRNVEKQKKFTKITIMINF